MIPAPIFVPMKINWSDLLTVLVALVIFKVLDSLFLDDLLSSVVGSVAGV